jgi:hypothetical protein
MKAIAATKYPNALAGFEKKALAEHEAVIERGISVCEDVGNALRAINDGKLYRESYKTFDAYVKERWNFAKRRAYQLMDGAAVIENVNNCAQNGKPDPDIPPPTKESHTRELGKVEPEKQAEVWKEVVETAPKADDGKPKITAAHVAEVVAQHVEPEPETETPQQRLCRADKPLAKKLWPAFDEHNNFVSVRDSINEALRTIKELAASPAGAFIHLQSVEADLNNAKKNVTAYEPYTTCPYCKGKGCKSCRTTGWIPKLIYNQVPGEMK